MKIILFIIPVIHRWIMAIDMYEKVAKNIAPKRESLHKAEVDHHESLEQLTRKKQQLREAQEKLKSVHDDMQVLFAIQAKKCTLGVFRLVQIHFGPCTGAQMNLG